MKESADLQDFKVTVFEFSDKPCFIGVKVIKAYPMSRHFFCDRKGIEKASFDEDGYAVLYTDNYISWSPKEVFESSYRNISNKELELIK